MNKKVVVVAIIVVFALLLGGAALLYRQLGNAFKPQQLAVQEPAPQEPVPDEEEIPKANTTPEEAPAPEEKPAPDEDAAPERAAAPDFTVYDLDGNAVTLTQFVGKPVVLNFWASWCGPCRSEMPGFQEKYLEHGEDVHFLMVNLTDGSSETVDSASEFINGEGYTFPVYYDTASDAAMTYGVYSVPTTYFIDAEGNAIAQAAGAIDAETLQKGIDMIYP